MVGALPESLAEFARGSSKKTYETCKNNLSGCARQIFIDGAILCCMYMLALYVIDGVKPTYDFLWKRAFKFMMLFMICSLVLRFFDVDYQDALSRGTAVVIAAKFVTALIPTSPQ
jgi:hypothetical protein